MQQDQWQLMDSAELRGRPSKDVPLLKVPIILSTVEDVEESSASATRRGGSRGRGERGRGGRGRGKETGGISSLIDLFNEGDNKYAYLGAAALNITGSKQVYCWGGGDVVQTEFAWTQTCQGRIFQHDVAAAEQQSPVVWETWRATRPGRNREERSKLWHPQPHLIVHPLDLSTVPASEWTPLMAYEALHSCAFVDRQAQNQFLADQQGLERLFPGDLLARFAALRAAELFHIHHARTCVEQLLHKPCQHDFSKDNHYLFVTILGFSFGLRSQLPAHLWQQELDFHFEKEPHHPQFEAFHPDIAITDDDIAEMAVDRLSRSLQFNGGQYDIAQLDFHLPQFVSQHETRIAAYSSFLKSFAPQVKEVWDQLKSASPSASSSSS